MFKKIKPISATGLLLNRYLGDVTHIVSKEKGRPIAFLRRFKGILMQIGRLIFFFETVGHHEHMVTTL
jgi:hypothetical protein